MQGCAHYTVCVSITIYGTPVKYVSETGNKDIIVSYKDGKTKTFTEMKLDLETSQELFNRDERLDRIIINL